MSMNKKNSPFLSVTILLLGLTVFLVQMTFANALPQSVLIRFGLSAILLVLSILLYTKNQAIPYGKIFYLFFIASAAVFISSLIGDWGLKLFSLETDSYIGIAVAKFSESLPIILVILILTRVIGANYDYLYLEKGRLKYGLLVGVLFFIGFTVLTLFTSDLMPLFNEKLQSNNFQEISKLIPWVLLFCFSNAFMEELLFRGLFLKYFESLIGFRFSNILTALIFSVAHLQVTYVTSMVAFLIVVFLLGIFLGNMMKKTNSIIASTLIHAGADVMLILPMFSKFI